DLGEAAEIDDPLSAVEAHEGRKGRAAVAVFAIEIILDEIAARPGDPVEQLQAAAEGERCAEWKLARWGQNGASRLGARLGGVEVEALVIDANRRNGEAVLGKPEAQRCEAGFLDQYCVASDKNAPRDDVECIGNAAGDDDLRAVAVDAAPVGKVACNGVPER